MVGMRRFDDIPLHTETKREAAMTEHIDLARSNTVSAQSVEAPCEARFPVAYSHGGFAQVRHAFAVSDLNPLGPIRVPADLEPTMTADYGASAVVFLRS